MSDTQDPHARARSLFGSKKKAAPPPALAIALDEELTGEPFQCPLGARADLAAITISDLVDADGTGLTLSADPPCLIGQVDIPGDYRLRLSGIRDGHPMEIIAHLTVLATPGSVWDEKPSDIRDQFWKPDRASQRVDGDLLCIVASVRGQKHARDGGFREDHGGLLVPQRGWHGAVVADGARSSPLSRRGSQLAVEHTLANLPALIDTYLGDDFTPLLEALADGQAAAKTAITQRLRCSLATACHEAARAIEKEARDENQLSNAYYTTVLSCLARRHGDGWFVACFWLGDGLVAAFDAQTPSVCLLNQADTGLGKGPGKLLHSSEFENPEALSQRIRFALLPRLTAVALMTDGIEEPKFPGDLDAEDALHWQGFWRDDLAGSMDFSPTNDVLEKQLLQWMDFKQPGYHDDRTLALMVPAHL